MSSETELEQRVLDALTEWVGETPADHALAAARAVIAEVRSRAPDAEPVQTSVGTWSRKGNDLWQITEIGPALCGTLKSPQTADFVVERLNAPPALPTLMADFTKSLPGGALDDSTYEQIEDALDAIDAPMTDGPRYMTLVERIKALRPTLPTREEINAEQIREVLRAHIFVNRKHDVAGLDEASIAILSLFGAAGGRRMSENCDICGKFVSTGAPGVSWSNTWGYDFYGMPELHDARYRCADCTEKHGRRGTNCALPEVYSGINPTQVSEAETAAG
jgi:hypothetical protein